MSTNQDSKTEIVCPNCGHVSVFATTDKPKEFVCPSCKAKVVTEFNQEKESSMLLG